MYKSKDFVELRNWILEDDSVVSVEEIKRLFEELISAANISAYVGDITIDGKFPAIAIYSITNDRYMGIYVYCQGNTIGMALEGKGEQIKATDLVKLYYKAAGALSGAYGGYRKSKDIMRRFGLGGTGSAIGAGVGVAAGAAIAGGAKLIAKGVKALLRDREAYDKEMAFYTLVLGTGDYLIGGTDSDGIIERLKENAEKENAIAQYFLGNAYAEGRGVEADFVEAVTWFAKAAENGEARSREIIAAEYLFGEREYSVEDKKIGLKYLKEMADNGDEDAAVNIIDIYGTGKIEGIPIDAEKMIEAAESYAERGNAYACMILAYVYDSVKVDSGIFDINIDQYKDDKKAFNKYVQVLQCDEPKYIEEAAMSLACMYRDGRGTEANKAEEIHYYEIAASKGNIEAKKTLAYYYTLGIGIEKNHSTAQRLCDELIRSGDQSVLPMAYYCSYVIADDAKKYKVSMDNARKYINCENADENIKDELEDYLQQQEEFISNMTDEERREYLQERKPLFSGLKKRDKNGNTGINKKILLIVVGIIIALLLGVLIAMGLMNDDKSEQSYSGAEKNITNSSTGYNVTTECKTTDIFTNNDTEILVRTEVDIPTVTGNEVLNSNVKEWTSNYESQAEAFREEYSNMDYESMEYMEPYSNPELYGTEYPVYFYYKDAVYIPTENDELLKTPRADESILSLVYCSYSETGGAHGYAAVSGGTFDVESGKLLSLDMITDDYEEFSNNVIAYIISEVEKKSQETYIFEEYEDTIRSLWDEGSTSWYMSDDSLVFIYNAYTLASYADGAIIVDVPYSVVSEFMNNKYI